MMLQFLLSTAEKMLTKDTKSYILYNLALSCAQISDYNKAFKYFEKAYK